MHMISRLRSVFIPQLLVVVVRTSRIESPLKVLYMLLIAGESTHVIFVQLPAPHSLILLQDQIQFGNVAISMQAWLQLPACSNTVGPSRYGTSWLTLCSCALKHAGG